MAYLFVAAFPGWSLRASTSLDGSWVLEINRLAERGAFGPDFAFTHGPLAYLLHPALVGSHPQQAAALRLAFAVGLVALTMAWARSAPTWRLALLAASCALATGTGLAFEYQIVLTWVLLGCVAADRRGSWPALLIAALAGAAVFVKLTLGLAGLAVVVSVLAARARIHGKRAWAESLAAALVFAAVLGAVAAATLGGIRNLGPWLKLGFEIASAFSEAMSLDTAAAGAGVHVVAGAAAVLAFGACALVWWWRHGRTGVVGVVPFLAAGPVFLAFKHGFVRRGFAHTEMYFPFVLAVLAVAMLRATGRRTLAALAGAIVIAAGLSAHAGRAYGFVSEASEVGASLVGARGAAAMLRWSRAGADDGWLQADLSPFSVPGLRDVAAGRTLGAFPFELAICGANEIDCAPMPTLQAYSAYTAHLDRLTAEHFGGGRAPRLLYVWADSIDGRSPILDTPAAWREIRWRYALAPVQPGPRLLLTRKREGPLPPLREMGASLVRLGAWNPVPPDRIGSRHLAVELDLTVWGKIRKLLYRIPQVVLVLKYSDGREVPVRIVPDTARNGLPIDDLVADAAGLRRLLEGGPPAAVPVAFGLDGEGLEYYRAPVRARWLGSD